MEPYAWAALTAQKDAAYWAAVAAITATLGLVVTVALNVGGLFFLWRQLKANEQAVKDAGAAASAAQSSAQTAMLTSRPWLGVEILASKVSRQPTHQAILMDVVVRNIGSTPAASVWFDLEIARSRDQRDLVDEIIHKHRRTRRAGNVLFPQEVIRRPRSLVIPKPESGDPYVWRIAVVVGYSIQGDPEPRFTSRTVLVARLHPENPAERMDPELAMSWHVDVHPAVFENDLAT